MGMLPTALEGRSRLYLLHVKLLRTQNMRPPHFTFSASEWARDRDNTAATRESYSNRVGDKRREWGGESTSGIQLAHL